MTITEFWSQFITDLRQTSLLEFLAVISGILSVWLSRIENIWVYPSGLVNTIIYIYLSFKSSLIGEASVNFYYTVVSIYGWILWARKNERREYVLQITYSSRREWWQEIAFFGFFYLVVFAALAYLKRGFAPLAIPWADAFASATAYTGMWLMARKKVESWMWWIATNIASIPLYFVKHYAFTSVYYLILLIMAVSGLAEWMRRAKQIRYAA
ncbi:MAG TPA: nicotinamide riboside transporter PnuC [Puia sp.]|nr:nicotinamide riboside transporter PnuC [Puia sp.]